MWTKTIIETPSVRAAVLAPVTYENPRHRLFVPSWNEVEDPQKFYRSIDSRARSCTAVSRNRHKLERLRSGRISLTSCLWIPRFPRSPLLGDHSRETTVTQTTWPCSRRCGKVIISV